MVSSTPAESSFITSFIEEDEQEHETSSQPSMSRSTHTFGGPVCSSGPCDTALTLILLCSLRDDITMTSQVCDSPILCVSATESSGSSSRCLSGSTGSDSGCVSSHLQEALQDDLSQHLSSQYISSVSTSTLDQSDYWSNHWSHDSVWLYPQKVAPVIGPASIVWVILPEPLHSEWTRHLDFFSIHIHKDGCCVSTSSGKNEAKYPEMRMTPFSVSVCGYQW